tara:strand:- start:292 stop:444 length:153 start_codon:yes stop_codon:yes gene_type:complete
VPVITVTKETHSKLKTACKAKGLKLTYAAEQAVLLYLKKGNVNARRNLGE